MSSSATFDCVIVVFTTHQHVKTTIRTMIVKITIYSIVIGLKNSYFPLIHFAKLLSDSLLLDGLLSDSSISQSHSMPYFTITAEIHER